MPTTYTTRNGSGKPAGGLIVPQRQRSTTVSSSIPVPPTSTVADNVASKKKSLLPQRTLLRAPAAGLRRAQTQSSGNAEPIITKQEQPIVETQENPVAPTEIPRPEPEIVKELPQTATTNTIPAPLPGTHRILPRPKSPIKPQQNETIIETQEKPVAPTESPRPEPEIVKELPQTATTNTNSAPRPRTDRILPRPKSPIKPQQNETNPTGSVVAKKTAMPPPARPTRSASLRQPSVPKISGQVDGKGHTRHRSQVLSARATGTTPVLPATSRQTEKTGTAAIPTIKPSRPQFNTYQQHFSPKKEKEASRTLSAVESRDAATAVRPEVTALQTELLQLYLLYSTSVQQDRKWQSGAVKQLKKQYQSVAATYSAVLEEERRMQEHLNLHALYDWSIDSASLAERDDGSSFQTQIQTFSRITQDVTDMIAEGSGRYTLVIRAFEEWLTQAEHVKRSRMNLSSFHIQEGDEPRYIDTLGRQWRDEVDDTTFKAERCLRELTNVAIFAINEDEFCRKHSNSALVQTARRHRDILRSMIEELKAMRAVEHETVNLEKAWVARAADQVNVDNDLHPRAGIWKTMT